MQGASGHRTENLPVSRISGLVVEYIVAIDVTRVLFPADAFVVWWHVMSIQGLMSLQRWLHVLGVYFPRPW